MQIQNVLKKELHLYLVSPIIFCLLSVFLALCGYLFYSNIVMTVLFQGTAIKIDLWQYTFNDIRFVLMFVLPVVSMRLLAEEKKLGTLELLMTNPLKRVDIVLGKYFSALTLLFIMFLFTVIYPVLYETFFNLDKGTILAGYLGLFLLGGCLLSMGLFISSLTNSQIVAAIATLGAGFFLWFIDRSEESASDGIIALLSHVSFQKHFFNFNRGILTLEDTIFFIAVSMFFIYLTSLSLKIQSEGTGLRTWKSNKTAASFFFGSILKIFMVFIFAVLIYALSYKANIRIDLTRDNTFSLSPVTINTLYDLEKPVNLKVFYETGKRYTYEDFLSMMARTSKYFSFSMLNLQRNASIASIYGIDSHGSGILEYDKKHNILNSVTEAGIVNALMLINSSQKKTVLIKNLDNFSNEFSSVIDILHHKGFELNNLEVSNIQNIPSDTKLAIIKPDPEDISAEEIQKLEKYFNNGGNILIIADPGPLPNTKKFLKKFNIEIYDDTITDRGHALLETGRQGVVMFFNREHPVTASLKSPAFFPSARSVQVGTNFEGGFSWTIIAQSGRDTETKLLDEYPEPDTLHSGKIPSAVAVEKRQTEEEKKIRGKMIVLGSSSFASNSNIDMLSNRDLFFNSVKWLSASKEKLIEAETTTSFKSPAYIHLSEKHGRIIFWSSVVLMPLFTFLLGILVIYRRRFIL